MKKLHFPFTILPAIILLCLIISCQSQQNKENIKAEEEMIAAEAAMKALSALDLESWNEGNLSLLDKTFSPECVRHFVDISEDVTGIEANKEYVTFVRTAFPDFSAAVDELIIKGDNMVLRWTITGTNTGSYGDLPPTGKKVKLSGVTISHIVDGKMNEQWWFYNEAAMLTQLGFTITPPVE